MKTKSLKRSEKGERGFTLLEIMAVVIIIVILVAIAVPRITDSLEKARENADIATGRQIKTALEQYRLENGHYPKLTALSDDDKGTIEDKGQIFISKYISKLTKDMTQQKGSTLNEGFGVEEFDNELRASNIIMIYLTQDGSKAAVQVFKGNGTLLWSSID